MLFRSKTQELVDSVQPKKKKAAATAVRAQVLSPPHSPSHPAETDSDSDSCSDMPPLIEGDAFFPQIDFKQWRQVDEKAPETVDTHPYRFLTFDRIAVQK